MNTSNINLKELYFEYKVLTKIIGEPDFEKLHGLFRELKANAAAVPCTLGGGANGYLGMLVTATQYTTISPTEPFTAPVMPAALILDPGFTQYQIALAKSLYDTALREYQMYILMQRSLISLVQEAVDSKYTYALRNRLTGQLPGDIRLVTNHLFNTYGKINEQELQEKHDTTLKITYDVSEPIDIIFNAVEDLCEIADLAGCPYSPRQQVNIGYLILQKQPIFRSDVRKWMRKTTVNKTWMNFIDHFRQAHQELRDTDTTINELGFQSANAIVEQIVAALQDESAEAQRFLPHPQAAAAPTPYHDPPSTTPAYSPPSGAPEYAPPQAPSTPPFQANAVLPHIDPNTALIQTMMQNMQMMHDNMHQNYFPAGRGRGFGRGRGGNRNHHGRGRGRGRGRTHTNGGKYCHTHGNCNHIGTECNTPGENHQSAATFANMMGGSTNRCYWIND